ncbi:MAG: T9SS type A sorting domain-containing protein, partial [Bacteroidales bacterium]|nr:T9SS type A sorting domain-containing protein [Bacteroidales bacterium]
TTIGTENVYVTLTDDNCTGVDTIVITIEVCNFTGDQQMPQISIYPVPSNSYITVQLFDNQKIESYSIYNLQGKLIKFNKINSANSFTITTNELTTGQYLIYVKTEEGVYTGGFVKE